MPLKETFDSKTVWEGFAHILNRKGNHKAVRAYARSSPIEGAQNGGLFALLHMEAIDSPLTVWTATVADHRARRFSIDHRAFRTWLQHIRAILSKDWDAIGRCPEDEHGRYVNGVAMLIREEPPDEALIDHLERAGIDQMRLGSPD